MHASLRGRYPPDASAYGQAAWVPAWSRPLASLARGAGMTPVEVAVTAAAHTFSSFCSERSGRGIFTSGKLVGQLV
jgi:hypothetical protein